MAQQQVPPAGEVELLDGLVAVLEGQAQGDPARLQQEQEAQEDQEGELQMELPDP